MLALRSLARYAPRLASRSLRTHFIATKPSIIPRPAIIYPTNAAKAFSTTRIRREPAGDSDAELSAKLNQERQLEVENKDPAALPQELEDFLNDSTWQVQDKPNTENIVFTRKFGNETIRVECSISDMNVEEELDDFDEDAALEDEPELDATSGGKRAINQSGVRGGKIDVAPEDSIAPSDREGELDDHAVSTDFPLNLNITIEKAGAGVTNIIARSQDGEIDIDAVSFFPRADLVEPTTPELAKESQEIYRGPPFSHLDPDLQAMYHTYVQERGINEQLSWFLTRYVDYKEQREYVGWLDNMRRFVDA